MAQSCELIMASTIHTLTCDHVKENESVETYHPNIPMWIIGNLIYKLATCSVPKLSR